MWLDGIKYTYDAMLVFFKEFKCLDWYGKMMDGWPNWWQKIYKGTKLLNWLKLWMKLKMLNEIFGLIQNLLEIVWFSYDSAH